MNPVLIIRHIENEGPGYLAEFLDQQKIPHKLVKIDQGQALPDSVDHIAGLVFMGGTMSVNDDLPWIPPALALIRQAHQCGVPVLGHCLGGQLIAKALGGTVSDNPVKEFGWQPVSVCRQPNLDWLTSLPEEFPAFHWHGETFSLPPGAQRILTNQHCANQGFVLDQLMALQCHIEMTETLIRTWIKDADDSLPAPSPSVQSPAAMIREIDTKLAPMQRAADVFYSLWIGWLKK
ncbi:MAG: type 1 glutamine amidotransferase [Gammaproteobacteria bacterium]|nr:type 1 glutamine amidotransferase [Gammaproteobacteria bacterium]